MNLWFLEYMVSGALGALLLSSALLLISIGLWRLRAKPKAGWWSKLAAFGVGLPMFTLALLSLVSSLMHSARFIELNESLPPLISFSIPQYPAGSIEKLPEAQFFLADGRRFKLQLNPYAAPNTVHSFLSLAETGFFDGYVFRRLEEKLVEVGDPGLPLMRDLLPSPGYSIYGEFEGNGYPNSMKFDRGDIGLAMQYGYTAAPAAFFIMNMDSPNYSTMMPAFGRVIEGMEIVDDIKAGETVNIAGLGISLDPVIIETILIETFGTSYPEPVKLPDTPLLVQTLMIGDWIEAAKKVVQ